MPITLGLRYVGFADSAYLRAEGANILNTRPGNIRIRGEGVVECARRIAADEGGISLRTYWYDAAFPREHRYAVNQRKFFTALHQIPGMQLRLGHIVEKPPWFQQGISDALRRTAGDFDVDANEMMDVFESYWSFRPDRKQKGVTTLMAVDLVRFACSRSADTAIIMAGDRSLTEPLRVAQNMGMRVILAAPDPEYVGRELRELADRIVRVEHDELFEEREPAHPKYGGR